MTRKELEDCLAKHFAIQPDIRNIHHLKWCIYRAYLGGDVVYTLRMRYGIVVRILPYKGEWIANFEINYITCKTACDVIKTIEEVWRL